MTKYKKQKNNNELIKLTVMEILPILENFLKKLSNNFEDLDYDTLEETYLNKMQEYIKKCNIKKDTKINGYSAFLSDKEFQKELRTKHKDIPFGKLSKIRGKIWKEFPEDKKLYYKNIAKKINNKNDIM
tara:strand:+ start:304 stop:690 length:387 start_codon:yes stop_codon:yes gene_type:complete